MGVLNQGSGIVTEFTDRGHFFCAYCGNDTAIEGLNGHGASCLLQRKAGVVFLPPKPIPLVDSKVKEGYSGASTGYED